MYTFTDGTFNVLYKNTENEIYRDIRHALKYTHVLNLQEVSSHSAEAALHRILKEYPQLEAYRPVGPAGELVILWNTNWFRKLPGRIKVRTHKGKAGISPHRYIIGQPLQHIDSGKKFMDLNTHVLNGFSRDELFNETDDWRDEHAQIHFLKILGATVKVILSGKYDSILLNGDMNVRRTNYQEWWYPGNLFAKVYDWGSGASLEIDQILYSLNSGISPVGKVTLKRMNSDHRLVTQEFRV